MFKKVAVHRQEQSALQSNSPPSLVWNEMLNAIDKYQLVSEKPFDHFTTMNRKKLPFVEASFMYAMLRPSEASICIYQERLLVSTAILKWNGKGIEISRVF